MDFLLKNLSVQFLYQFLEKEKIVFLITKEEEFLEMAEKFNFLFDNIEIITKIIDFII